MALRSRITTDGLDRTPHRAFMRAMGLDDAAISKPMIGVVSQKGETTPCNMTHGPQVDAAKDGVSAAGGTPREFTTISVSDGIGMNHEGMKFSLVSRELIADSIEAVVQGHAYDGLVAFGGCDKTLPGAMMGLVRCNVPGVFLFGGAALPGRFEGRDVTVLDAYEGVGAVQTGAMSESDLEVLERACKPSIGACAGQFTANTMAMVAEALGLTVPNSAMVPGVYSERLAIAKRAGEIVMQIVNRGGPLPRDLVTRRALENASAIVAATGGSTNAALHIPAIANEAGIRFTVDDVAAVFARTPLIGDLRPGGKYLAKDVYEHGGVSVIIRALVESGHMDGDGLTVTGRTLREEHGGAPMPDGAIVRAAGQRTASRRRARGAERQSRARRCAVESRRPQGACVRGHRARVRQRGRLRADRAQSRLHGRRGTGDPLRGAAWRARHARNARRHRADLRPADGRESRAAHRRAILRRDARHLRRPHHAGSRRRRASGVREGRRPHPHRCRCQTHRRAARSGRTRAPPRRVAAADAAPCRRIAREVCAVRWPGRPGRRDACGRGGVA